MKPSKLADRLIDSAFRQKLSVMVWGSSGIGKSSLTQQIAKKLGVEYIDLRLSQLDPEDLRGLPVYDRDAKRMTFALPDFLPTDPNSQGILNLDEINLADPSVMNAAYQLILDRRLGSYKLPDGWAIIALGNRTQDRGNINEIPAPLSHRMIHYDFDVNFDDWTLWANQNNIHEDIISFLRFRPALLNDYNPNMRVSPTPRTWEFVSRKMSSLDPEVEFEEIQGIVGEGATAELMAFMKIRRSLPNVDALLMNPDAAEVPTDPCTCYALSGALTARADENNFERIIKYVGRMLPEFQVMTVRDCIQRKPVLQESKEFTHWVAANASILA